MPKITKELIDKNTQGRARSLEKRKRFIHGDHWLNGEGWPGGVPVGKFDSYQTAQTALQKAFAPLDILSDIIGFHCDAVGSDSLWSVTVERGLKDDEKPSDDEQALIDEAEALLTVWWDSREAQTTLRTALESLLWANVNEVGKRPLTVSPLRLLIPGDDETDEQGNAVVRVATPQEAAMKIFFEAPDILHAGSLKDENGILVGHYYQYSVAGVAQTEIHTLGKYISDDPRVAEQTVVGIFAAVAEESKAQAYELGGSLLMFEMTSTRWLINDGAVSEQKQINLINTLRGVNLKDHGFTQESILNADVPGVWRDGAGNIISAEQAGQPGQNAKFEADPIPKGPNVVRAFEGIRTMGADGKETIAPVSIVRAEPSSNVEFRDSKIDAIDTLYFLARQLHRRMSGDAASSGEARITATNDFISSLAPTGLQYQRAVQWVLTTVLRLAAYLSRRKGRYDGLKVVCKVKYSAVQPTPDMLRALSEMRDKDQLDTQTHLELTGVTNDVDATVARMRAEGILESGAAERANILIQLADKGRITPEELRQELIDLGILPDKLKAAQPTLTGQLEEAANGRTQNAQGG